MAIFYRNQPEVFSQLEPRFHQVVFKVVKTIFEDVEAGNIFLKEKERAVLRKMQFDDDVILMTDKKRGKKYRSRQKIFSRVINRLASRDFLPPLDLPLMEITKTEVKNLIKTGVMSYQTYQKAAATDQERISKRRFLSRAVPATAFSLIAAKNLLRRTKPSLAQGGSPEEIAQAEGIRLSHELGVHLCKMFNPIPVDQPEKIEIIQPSDVSAYDTPPQEVGHYFKEDNQKRLANGLTYLYYHGLIEFTDGSAKEFLPHPALIEITNKLTNDIITQLKTPSLDPLLKVAFLNQTRKVDGALVTDSQIAEEFLIFLQGTKAINIRFLPCHSKEKGYDDDPQLEAARRRQAYLQTQLAFSQAKNNQTPLEEGEKLTNIEMLLAKTGINEEKIPLLTNRVEKMTAEFQKLDINPWDFISYLVKLSQEANSQIDLETTLLFLDPEEFARQMENVQTDFELPPSILLTPLFFGSVIALPERQGLGLILKRLRQRVPQSEEKPEGLLLTSRKMSRRELFKLAGTTLAAAALAEVATDPADEGLTILNTIQPEILEEVGKGLSRLMIRPLLAKEPGALKILANDGQTVIGEQAKWGFRKWLPVSQIPKEYIEAQTKTEDASFLEHCGVDPRGLTRAAIKTMLQGSWQGGSTITMQVVKHFIFDELGRRGYLLETGKRKAVEVLTALAWEEALEKELGSKKAAKEFIFEIYANIAPFGPNIYGLKASAEKYFSKQPPDLTLAEITFLVGLPQDPIGHDPFNHFDEARTTQKAVSKLLVNNGAQFNGQALTQTQADEIFNQGIQLTPKEPTQINPESPYYFLCDWILALRQKNLSEEAIKQGGEIITSVDPKLQLELKGIIDEYLAGEIAQKYQVGQAAAVVMDTSTGEVLAAFGNPRQDISPGSTVKLFTYAEALEKGKYPDGQATETDVPVKYQGQTFTNHDGTASGKKVSLGVALRQSLNTVALNIAIKTGSISLAKMYQRFGLIPDKNTLSLISPAMTLGTIRVNLLHLAEAYASLARQMRVQSSPISQVKSNASGQTVYSANPAPSQQPIIDPEVAKEVLRMISDPNNLPHDASGKIIDPWRHLNGPFAAKTGTSYNPSGGPKDVLITGVTLSERPEASQYSVVVWLGPEEGKDLKEDATALPVVGPLYKQIMDYLLTQYPAT